MNTYMFHLVHVLIFFPGVKTAMLGCGNRFLEHFRKTKLKHSSQHSSKQNQDPKKSLATRLQDYYH